MVNKKSVISKIFFIFFIFFLFSKIWVEENVSKSENIEKKFQKTDMIDSTFINCQDCNLILISIDTLRADHVSGYGYRKNTTPSIDKLAKSGIIFKQAFSQSSWTIPSHASMLTSSYSSLWGKRLGENEGDNKKTISEIFQDNEYTTIAITGGGNMASDFGFDRGFDIFNGNPKTVEQGMTETIDLIIKNKDKKIFLFFHTYQVHCPYETEPEFDIFYNGEKSNQTIYPCGQTYKSGPYIFNSSNLLQDDLERIISIYDGNIRRVDFQINRLVNILRKKGLLNKTMLIITSDHGEEFLDHGHVGHGNSLHDELVHVPLIFLHPGLLEKKINNEFVGLIDIVPTIVDIFNLSTNQTFDGISLKDEKTVNKDKKRKLYARVEHTGVNENLFYMVRSKRYKYIIDEKKSWEGFYDLKNDPSELDILIKSSKISEGLARDLNKWKILFQPKNIMENDDEKNEISEETLTQLKQLGYL